MPAQNLSQILAEVVRTVTYRDIILDQINNLLNKFSEVNTPDFQYIQNNYPGVYEVLLKGGLEKNNKPDQNDLLEIKKYIQNLETVRFEIPTQVTTIPNDMFFSWLKNYVHDAISDVRTSTDFVSGITYSYKGRYNNLTLDTIIRERVHA
jgi:hypothetical protein